jgi:hypothetical protein
VGDFDERGDGIEQLKVAELNTKLDRIASSK